MDLDKIDLGWVKLHRKMRKWKYSGKLKYEKVWQTILLEANYDDQEFEGVTIKRGELIFSYRSYAEKLKHCEPEITIRNIRTIIKNLETEGQILVYFLGRKKFTVISVINYEKYQGDLTNEYQTKLEQLELKLNEKQEEINKMRSEKKVNDAEKIDTVTQGEPTHKKEKTDTVNFENRHAKEGTFNQWQKGVSEINEVEATRPENETDTVQIENRHSDAAKSDTSKRISSSEEEKKLKKIKTIYVEKSENFVKKSKKDIELEAKQKEKEIIFDIVVQTVEYLNNATGQKLRVTEGGGHYKIISRRIKEEYTFEQFKKVIDYQTNRWLGTKWQGGLSTKKIFGDEFDTFLNQSEIKSDLSLDDDFMEYGNKEEREEREEIKKKEEAFKEELKRVNKELDKELKEIEDSKKTVISFDKKNIKDVYGDIDDSDW